MLYNVFRWTFHSVLRHGTNFTCPSGHVVFIVSSRCDWTRTLKRDIRRPRGALHSDDFDSKTRGRPRFARFRFRFGSDERQWFSDAVGPAGPCSRDNQNPILMAEAETDRAPFFKRVARRGHGRRRLGREPVAERAANRLSADQGRALRELVPHFHIDACRWVQRLNHRNETQPARVQPRSDEIRVATAARVVPATEL